MPVFSLAIKRLWNLLKIFHSLCVFLQNGYLYVMMKVIIFPIIVVIFGVAVAFFCFAFCFVLFFIYLFIYCFMGFEFWDFVGSRSGNHSAWYCPFDLFWCNFLLVFCAVFGSVEVHAWVYYIVFVCGENGGKERKGKEKGCLIVYGWFSIVWNPRGNESCCWSGYIYLGWLMCALPCFGS